MSAPVTTPVTVNISVQKIELVAQLEAFIEGLATLLPGIDPFILTGITIGRADLLARVQARIAAVDKTKADRKVLAADVAAEKALDLELRPLMKGMKAFLVSRFGDSSPQVQQMGFTQSRRPRKNAQALAAGVVKAKATRKALGTKGDQQKAAALAALSEPAPAPAAAATVAAPRPPSGTPSGAAG